MGQETWKCYGCEKTFLNTKVEYEDIPRNMFFETAQTKDKKVMKCPHCGDLAFFGFEVVDIAF